MKPGTLPACPSSEPQLLEVGRRVRVKTTMLGKRIGITPIPRRGGEGVVSRVELGKRRKVIYIVTMLKDGRQRPVYPKDLVARRQPKPKKRRRMKQ
jgi:hypothetical protein